MESYPFIFSDEPTQRFRRHAFFWCFWWAFQSFLYSFVAGFRLQKYSLRLPVSALESLIYLLPHMFLAYTLMYLVTPRLLLKGRYKATILAIPALFLCTGAISTLVTMTIIVPLRIRIFGPSGDQLHPNEIHFFLGLLAGLRGAITIGGLAAAIKLMKYWYVKEQRNLQLQRENIEAQLQVLRAQVHPHFLFNTLNNIYANAQAAPVAARMIMGLSDLLRYMLYEGNRPLVPLEKEFQMLREYIELERMRYGNDLELSIDLPKDTGGLLIAPLLLLPYLENCFKHGASRMIEQPWIGLQATLEDDWLLLKIVNAKPEGDNPGQGGIGMNNVSRRLSLLYPQRHDLEIISEDELFIVNLALQLEKDPSRARIIQPADAPITAR